MSATASSELPVTFTSGTPSVCTSSGSAGATVTLLATGTCVITAHQAGNANYASAPDVGQSFTVGNGKSDQTITFGVLGDRTMVESPFTVSATASSGLAVKFTTTTPLVCTSSGTNGTTITLIATGLCMVQANQNGNAAYNAAPPVNRDFMVTKASQTIGFSPLSNRTLAQSPFSVSATASSGLAVTFATTTPAVCRSTGKNGSTIKLVARGTCTVQATQLGNARYDPAVPVAQSFTVQ